MEFRFRKLQERDQFYTQAKHLSPSITVNDDWDTFIYKLFMEKIEFFTGTKSLFCKPTIPFKWGALATQEKVQTTAGEIKLKPDVRKDGSLFCMESKL